MGKSSFHRTQPFFELSTLFRKRFYLSHLSFSRENPSEKLSCGSGMLQEKEKMSEVDGHPQQEKSRKRSIDQSSSVIDIKIKGQDGVEVFFRIQTNTMLLKVFRAYCQKRNLAYKTVEFLYEGDRFPVKRTPHDVKHLNMRDGDQIDAMTHQDGGGL
ncbi:small ubiquitin-related modifier 1-like isoform X1 [Camellia sinensis]|uniref:small ubiquitin-related modifier 1-like isoform X1 n=1 Tax=Camellia sinensis TaxID=4442 RepID=UPI001035D889|nr:small ubiquitin-related modifier 1-like isoform X1 [Camellia sinensis]